MRRWVTGHLPAIFIVGLIFAGSLGLISAGGNSSPGEAALQNKINLLDGRWSDPAIWNDGKVPISRDAVTINKATQVVYDLFSEAEIAELNVEGTLTFSRDVSTNLDVGDVFVRPEGYLEIGTESQPIPAGVQATLRFVNSTDGEHSLNVMGEAQIHGQPLGYVYTTLKQDADRGSVVLNLQDRVDWKPGDHIVITSTTQDPLQSEEAYIAKVTGRAITLDTPLKYHHDGRAPAQAQVALLTRNVVITSKNPQFRGHTRFLEGAKGSISYAEFSHLGARGELGKYPIHFHMAGETIRGSYVKGASIWDSGNRFITVHSTQYVSLSYNIGYNAVGHGFFFEIGDEVYVTMDHNLGILVTRGDILVSDRYASIFWVQNAHNSVTNNIAVSSKHGDGFQFAIPAGRKEIAAMGGNVEIRKLPLLKFEGNETHSNKKFGVKVSNLYTPPFDMSDFAGSKVWRNGQRGLSMNGNRTKVSGSTIFGNGDINVFVYGDGNVFEDTKIMGELEFARAQDQMVYPVTPRGIVLLKGKNNTISRVRLEGHESFGGVMGSDISLGQDHNMPVTALEARLKSPAVTR